MEHLLHLIDSAGLNTPEKVDRVTSRWPIKRLQVLREQLWEILRAGSDEALKRTGSSDPFDFVASSSMRGEDGCLGWDCRIQKARTLSRYGALYARRVLIPVRVGVSPVKGEHEFFTRYNFAGALMAILEYRPLIESGVAILSAGVLPYCRECLDAGVPSYPRIKAVANSLFIRESKKFSATTGRTSDGLDRLELRGPEAYLPHGVASFGFHSSLFRTTGNGKSRRKPRLTASHLLAWRKSVVKQLFHRLAYDVTIQQYFTASNKATYLTDMLGEAQVLSLLNESEENESRNALFAKHLLHTVPLLNEVPIDIAIKLRKEEPDAFELYRTTIAKIIRECSKENPRLSEKDAKKVSSDILEPGLARLRIQANSIRRAGRKKLAAKILGSSAVIGMGLYAGVFPPNLAGVLTMAGTVTLLSQIGEAIALIEKNPAEIKSHDLYFLLKLQSRASK